MGLGLSGGRVGRPSCPHRWHVSDSDSEGTPDILQWKRRVREIHVTEWDGLVSLDAMLSQQLNLAENGLGFSGRERLIVSINLLGTMHTTIRFCVKLIVVTIKRNGLMCGVLSRPAG